MPERCSQKDERLELIELQSMIARRLVRGSFGQSVHSDAKDVRRVESSRILKFTQTALGLPCEDQLDRAAEVLIRKRLTQTAQTFPKLCFVLDESYEDFFRRYALTNWLSGPNAVYEDGLAFGRWLIAAMRRGEINLNPMRDLSHSRSGSYGEIAFTGGESIDTMEEKVFCRSEFSFDQKSLLMDIIRWESIVCSLNTKRLSFQIANFKWDIPNWDHRSDPLPFNRKLIFLHLRCFNLVINRKILV